MRAHHFWMTITKREKLQCKIHNPAFIVSSSCQLRGRWCKLERIPDQWEEQCFKIEKNSEINGILYLAKKCQFSTLEAIKHLKPKTSKLYYLYTFFKDFFCIFENYSIRATGKLIPSCIVLLLRLLPKSTSFIVRFGHTWNSTYPKSTLEYVIGHPNNPRSPSHQY